MPDPCYLSGQLKIVPNKTHNRGKPDSSSFLLLLLRGMNISEFKMLSMILIEK